MWNWMLSLRRKKIREVKRVYVREEDIDVLLELFDAYLSISHKGDCMAKRRFWQKAIEMYPEVEWGDWIFHGTNPISPYFEKEVI